MFDAHNDIRAAPAQYGSNLYKHSKITPVN